MKKLPTIQELHKELHKKKRLTRKINEDSNNDAIDKLVDIIKRSDKTVLEIDTQYEDGSSGMQYWTIKKDDADEFGNYLRETSDSGMQADVSKVIKYTDSNDTGIDPIKVYWESVEGEFEAKEFGTIEGIYN